MFRAAPKTFLVATSAIATTLVACSGTAPAQSPTTRTAAPTAPPASIAATASATQPPAATPRSTPTARPSPTLDPTAVGYPDLPGWIVFEHFGANPDGSSAGLNFDNRMIWMVHADGSDLHELSPSVPSGGKTSPDVSPDGKTVAFNTWTHPRIWTSPIDGGEPTLISTDCDGGSHCIEGEPSYSGDGTKLAFVRQSDEDGVTISRIGVRDLESGDVEMLDATTTDAEVGYVTQPAFAPDGSAIVYYRVDQTPLQDRPTGSQLQIVNADGSNVYDLPTAPNGWAADPDWSPDGSLIVFSQSPNRETEGWATDDGAPSGGIYTIRPDGTDLVQVCDECLGGGGSPSFTADGRIFFWGYLTFALMDADGGNAAHINAPKLTWFGDRLGYGYAGWLVPEN